MSPRLLAKRCGAAGSVGHWYRAEHPAWHLPQTGLPVGEVARLGGVSCPPKGRGGRRGQLPHTQRNPQLRKGLSWQIAPQPKLAAQPHATLTSRNPKEGLRIPTVVPERDRKTWLEGSGSPADPAPHTHSLVLPKMGLCLPAPAWIST